MEMKKSKYSFTISIHDCEKNKTYELSSNAESLSAIEEAFESITKNIGEKNMVIKVSAQEIITYEKIINIPRGDYLMLSNSFNLARDIIDGYMQVQNVENVEYKNGKIKNITEEYDSKE